MLETDAVYIGVAADHVIESFRNRLWPDYKTGAGIERALRAQFHPLEEALAAMGVVDIRRGLGGGARISYGNPQRFAEALAVQLELAGIDAAEILVAQHGVECLAAELAARHATPEAVERLKALIARAESALDDADEFTRLSLEFHLAVADASANRVLHYQLVSLQHVSWPARNRTLTPPVARHVLEAHRQLARLIEARDSAGARRAMDAHVGMIGGRRLAEKKVRQIAFC